nr:MAG TPA: Protein of unknown function (DUF551) [Caudoviricetes sp.]
MTDQEIVRALRCCAKGLGHDDACENCKVGEIQNRREYIEFAAANVIERLTAENAALREKVPEWISVEDRLPSPGARVLITDGVFVGEGFLAGKAFFGRGEGTSWKRYSNIPWDKSMKTEITHWMPLPGAPEEGDT